MALVLWRSTQPSGAPAIAGGPQVGAAPGEASAAAAKETKGPDTIWVIAAYGLVSAAALGGWVLFKVIDPAVFTPTAAFTAFAPLYILAQGIERFLEPFTKFLGATSEGGQTKSKEQAMKERDATFATLAATPTQVAADTAALSQSVLERIRRNTVVIAWGIASAAGMLACGAFGIRLLNAIGFQGVPAFWDIAITGLAVGSGTKPLHDLISTLQKTKDTKANPPGAATTD